MEVTPNSFVGINKITLHSFENRADKAFYLSKFKESSIGRRCFKWFGVTREISDGCEVMHSHFTQDFTNIAN